jgi:ABC-type transport system involved in multi-copper enzyme maturation permease subunit
MMRSWLPHTWIEPDSELFGPLLGYDLVRTARRHIILHRCLYLFSLAGVLYLIYSSRAPAVLGPALFDTYRVDNRMLARFAESFFASFVLLQFAVVSIVTPAYTATVMASEKANRTLELLLATHLTSREIVLGILASRLGTLFLLLLGGVPVISVLTLVGGIAPAYVVAAFIALAVTTVSVGAISILVSIHARNPLAAVLGAYSVCIPYVAICALVPTLLVLDATMEIAIVGSTLMYVLFHGVVGVSCLVSAISSLRAAACDATPAVLPKAHDDEAWNRGRARRGSPDPAVLTTEGLPALDADATAYKNVRPTYTWRHVFPAVQDDDALLWKEVNQRPLFLANETKSTIATGLATFLGLYGLVVVCAGLGSGAEMFMKTSNFLVRVLGIFPACIALVAIAFNATNRVLREREQHTLDSLLMIPVARREILVAKWKASILSYRWVGLIIASVWLLGLITAGLSILALPVLALAVCVYVAMLANLGLWFSTWCRTMMRAMLATSITAAFLLIGPGIVWRIALGWSLTEEPGSWLALFAYRGLSPILTFWTLSFGYDGVATPVLQAALAGVACHGLLAFALWRLVQARFQPK